MSEQVVPLARLMCALLGRAPGLGSDGEPGVYGGSGSWSTQRQGNAPRLFAVRPPRPRLASAREGLPRARRRYPDLGSRTLNGYTRWHTCGVAFLLMCVLCGCGKPHATIATDPPGASIWVNGELIGPSPQTIECPASDEVRIRVTMPGKLPAERLISSDKWSGDLPIISLEAEPRLVIRCSSRPSGVDVLVDSLRRGATPLIIEDLAPGEYQLVFKADGRESITRSITLADEDATIDVYLRNLSEDLYTARIKEDPTVMANYVDLAHEYMLDKKFDRAMAVLKQALPYVIDGKADDTKRFWAEVNRITTMQYDYGDATDLQNARGHLLLVLKDAIGDDMDRPPELYGEYVLVMAALGDYDKAEEILRKVMRHRGNDRYLRQIAQTIRRYR